MFFVIHLETSWRLATFSSCGQHAVRNNIPFKYICSTFKLVKDIVNVIEMCARLKFHIMFLLRTNFKLAIHLNWWEWWMERWMCEGCWQEMESIYEVFGRCWGHEISIWRYFINFMNSIKHENNSINAFNEMLCSDISKDEDGMFFPACNPAARLPHGLVFGGRFTGLLKYVIRRHICVKHI